MTNAVAIRPVPDGIIQTLQLILVDLEHAEAGPGADRVPGTVRVLVFESKVYR